MNIGSVTTGAVASAVWAQASRTITGQGLCFNNITVTPTVLASGTQVDVRPVATRFRSLTFMITNVVAGGVAQLGTYDGVTFTAWSQNQTTETAPLTCFVTNPIGPVLKNTGTMNITYSYSGWEVF